MLLCSWARVFYWNDRQADLKNIANSFIAFFFLLITKGVVLIINHLGISRRAQVGFAFVLKAQVLSGVPSPGL